VSPGIDALGEVSVKVEADAGTFIGRGASTDIIVASGKAYLNALNKVVAARREREAGRLGNGRSKQYGPAGATSMPAAQPAMA
jgi:2-isopropylmalate synthase